MSEVPANQYEPEDSQSQPAPAWLRWLETLAVTALFLGLGAWNRPEDPFYLTGNFPWPALAPVLAGLRYGFFTALVSALLVLGALGISYRVGLAPVADFPYVWCIGVLAFSLLAGEFRDFWGRRLEKLEASNRYREVRLEEFTRNFYLLKVSHDRLEQQIAGSTGSLREALRRLYQETAYARGAGLTQETGELLLNMLIRYGQLQSAAIYPVVGPGLADTPIAHIGAYHDVRPDDPLLMHAVEEKKLVSIQTEYRDKLSDLDTDLLLALPLIDSRQTLIGMVAIKAMPFFNFQPRTLRLLAILTGHMADMIQEQQLQPDAATAEWRHFLFQLSRSSHDAAQHGLPASLIRLGFAQDGPFERVAERVQRLRRGLDVIAELPAELGKGLALLLPLTDELGQAAYLQRLDEDLREHTGQTLAEQAEVRTGMVSGNPGDNAWLTTARGVDTP